MAMTTMTRINDFVVGSFKWIIQVMRYISNRCKEKVVSEDRKFLDKSAIPTITFISFISSVSFCFAGFCPFVFPVRVRLSLRLYSRKFHIIILAISYLSGAC